MGKKIAGELWRDDDAQSENEEEEEDARNQFTVPFGSAEKNRGPLPFGLHTPGPGRGLRATLAALSGQTFRTKNVDGSLALGMHTTHLGGSGAQESIEKFGEEFRTQMREMSGAISRLNK